MLEIRIIRKFELTLQIEYLFCIAIRIAFQIKSNKIYLYLKLSTITRSYIRWIPASWPVESAKHNENSNMSRVF